VNTTVNKLRQLLGDSNEQSAYVQTIPRKGYSFISPVEYVEQPEPAVAAAALELESTDDAAALESVAPSSTIFAPHRAKVWFTAGVVALVVSAMLLGAAITLYAHRAF
jgi:DNA-binding winged helix-turn-helix (wHTH) protein